MIFGGGRNAGKIAIPMPAEEGGRVGDMTKQ